MPLSDYEIADIIQKQYDGVSAVFDKQSVTSGVTWALKHYSDCDIIAFEGSHTMPDWERDFDAQMVQVEGLGGVHEGFYSGLPETLEVILPLISKDKPITVCGHSLGGGESHIFTGMLARSGFTLLETVTFGSPLPGDQQLSDLIAPYPNRSYWNYHTPLEHDFVGSVPVWLLDERYLFPRQRILINEVPPVFDAWGLLSWHHFYLYAQGVNNHGQSNTGTK